MITLRVCRVHSQSGINRTQEEILKTQLSIEARICVTLLETHIKDAETQQDIDWKLIFQAVINVTCQRRLSEQLDIASQAVTVNRLRSLSIVWCGQCGGHIMIQKDFGLLCLCLSAKLVLLSIMSRNKGESSKWFSFKKPGNKTIFAYLYINVIRRLTITPVYE